MTDKEFVDVGLSGVYVDHVFGNGGHKRGWNKLIDRTERIDKSIFRLGMDWLNHSLKTGKDLFVEFFMPYQKSVR